MKTIKLNSNSMQKKISTIILAFSAVLLSYPCFIWGYEPENPKLKQLKRK
ncbi:hypothetical protein IGI66_002876 [Enterococcus sp. AZ048]|nr:hypothetical protein A5865_001982 [Enterococcus sp. 12E11_DIV0728]OUZ13650.1 hypothetical protein A5868_002672 [Enterococcus sp. 12F9_DIV0723]